ncbi:ATP-binding protein [Alkalihalobacterium sp. APHAB7]|uniref:ATP-binding protein n=1 Tax=Alkalihalobacterium sp. APHAB7 TaxID=3402081 RepID=UPI003AAD0364
MRVIREKNLNSSYEGWERKILVPFTNIERHQAIIAQITHEVNNALTVIQGTLQLYKAETKDPTTRTLIELSELNAQEISKVLEEYKSYLGRPSKLDDINLVTLVEDLLLEYKEKLSIFNVVTLFENRLSVVRGEFNRLNVCFSNVIRNSIEAMSEGGTLRISVVQVPSGYKIIFEDNGCGMCELELYRFGNPVYQLSSKSKERGQLSLLGLISNFPSNISIFSKKDSGTSVEIVFPIHQ